MIYKLKPHKGKSIQDLVKLGDYDYANSEINNRSFKVEPIARSVELIHFDEYLSTPKVLERLGHQGLRAANMTELLTFGAQNPNEQRHFPIVSLGSVWSGPDGDRSVGGLWGGASRRELRLVWLDGDWYVSYRFLAVRKPEPSSSEPQPSLGTLEISEITINGKKYRVVEDE